MYNSPMFAFADQGLGTPVSSTISKLIFGQDIPWITAIVGVFILSLPIWFIVFFSIFKASTKEITDLIVGIVRALEVFSNNDRMMFIRMGEQLEETKKTNKILSKLVVEKKPNSTDDR